MRSLGKINIFYLDWQDILQGKMKTNMKTLCVEAGPPKKRQEFVCIGWFVNHKIKFMLHYLKFPLYIAK